MANSTISKITLPSGNTYDIKDAFARDEITKLQGYAASGVTYLGTTTTALTDGSTVAKVTVGENTVDAKVGGMVNYNNVMYAWNGTQWDQLGSAGAIKALAYKDSVSGTYTPAGTIESPSFTGDSLAISADYTPAGDVAIAKGTGVANYTPEGTVTAPTFTGKAMSISADYTPAGSVAIKVGTGTANYTPAGTVAVTPNTATVKQVASVGTLPSCTLPEMTANVTDETLSLGWTAGSFAAGTLPTTADATVATGVKSATFTGTGTELTASFTGTAGKATQTVTPTGEVGAPTFKGTGVDLEASFTGTAGKATQTVTPSGKIGAVVFKGTQGTVESK